MMQMYMSYLISGNFAQPLWLRKYGIIESLFNYFILENDNLQKITHTLIPLFWNQNDLISVLRSNTRERLLILTH